MLGMVFNTEKIVNLGLPRYDWKHMHHFHRLLSEKYGPMVRYEVPGLKMVFLFDAVEAGRALKHGIGPQPLTHGYEFFVDKYLNNNVEYKPS